ncbi:MAG: FG-GAP repeat domain-containing protein [Planctomycetota bacterium]|jgi:hypothetical protein
MSGRVCANRSAAKASVLLLCAIFILSGNARGKEEAQTGQPEGIATPHPGITVVANNIRLKMAIYQWSYEGGSYRLLRATEICDAHVLPHNHNHLGVGDISGDGQDDVVIGTSDGVYMIDGASSAFCRRIIESEQQRVYVGFMLAVGDYDGDGLDEIIHASLGGVKMYGWNGNSIQQENEIKMRPGEIALADVDGDGKVEILFKKYGDSIRIYQHSQGSCTLKAELTKSPDWRGFGREKFDARPQELKLDMSSSQTWGDKFIFPIVKTTFQHFDILDFNDDSYPDIAVCGMGGVQIICNRAGREFEPAGFAGDITSFGPHLKVCDIDHDGREDVVVSAKKELIVLGVDKDGVLGRKFATSNENEADGSARQRPIWSPISYVMGHGYRHMKFFDTNGDGKGELVTPEYVGGDICRVVVWKYEGGSNPGLRRAWSSDEHFYGSAWIVEGQLSQKIQDRLEQLQ